MPQLHQDADQFIEVSKVISDNTNKMNVGSAPYTINISDIMSFRPWHKGPKDTYIKGDITHVVLRKTKPTSEGYVMNGGNPEKDTRTISDIRTFLIEESYEAFKFRLSQRVGIKLLPDDLD